MDDEGLTPDDRHRLQEEAIARWNALSTAEKNERVNACRKLAGIAIPQNGTIRKADSFARQWRRESASRADIGWTISGRPVSSR